MPVIDMHAHVTPERFKRAIEKEGSWYGLPAEQGQLHLGNFAAGVDVRLAAMDAAGVDMQVVTPNVGFYQYANDLEVTKQIHRECNDEMAEMVADYPERFAGMGIAPMQDVPSAIEELDRMINELGLSGVMMSDSVAGQTYDEPQFLPFFKAAEEMGAIVFFHQGGPTVVNERIDRYKLGNSIGYPTERALTFAALVFGGVMDYCPDLKPLLAHGGGYTCFGSVRMDKACGALDRADTDEPLTPRFDRAPDELYDLQNAPSDYLDRFHYDCITYSGPLLRFLIDRVGHDRVVLGTDHPAPMELADPVRWIRGLPELSDVEKEAILVTNPGELLGR